MDDVGVIRELAGLDEREKKLRTRAEEVPLLIEETRKKMEDAQEEITGIRNDAEERKRIIRTLELEIQEMTEKLDKYSKQLLDIKTNKEFQSLQKEMADVERAIGEREDQLLETMDRLEECARLIESAEAKTKSAREQEENNLRELEKELQDTEVQLIEVSEKRKRAVERLSPQLREDYVKVRSHYAGDAIVAVSGGVCTGCYVNIPPNIVGELHAASRIIRCEQCGRFLYYSDECD
jgi:predicted  nucleic acid-binding Zn-ribbon protein